jgi:putative transposase
MAKQRKPYSAELKARIALEAIKGQQTLNAIAAHYGVHPNQVMQWKKQALAELPHIFAERRTRMAQDEETLRAQLYQQMGQLKVELDWLKKKVACSVEAQHQLIERGHPLSSVRRQCALLGVSRARLYYEPRRESADKLRLMRLLDEQYTRTPYYGIRRMTAWLRTQGDQVNHKRVQRRLRLRGLEAIYQQPRLSQLVGAPQVYPSLLGGVNIARVNPVWSTDITYIRLRHGFVYLVAILDWFSRYVVAWEVSVTLDSNFCIRALERALVQAQPEIFHSDQGAQFTSLAFTARLKARGIHISMDGRGRALDNIFVERLWRTVKYAEVYLHEPRSVPDAICHLGRYFTF